MSTSTTRAALAALAVRQPRGLLALRRSPQGTPAAAARARAAGGTCCRVRTSASSSRPTQDVVGVVQVVKASKEDTLTDIARRFNVGYEEIVRANPKVDPWLPGEGTEIVVPSQFILPNAPRTGRRHQHRRHAALLLPDAQERASRRWSSRTRSASARWAGARPKASPRSCAARRIRPGACRSRCVKEHHENGEELEPVIGPGPDNPLGKYAFYLQWPSYLIHGTNKPAGVGLRSSHGCIRLYPEDIEQFFDMVPIGTQVRVVNQPFVFGWHDGQLYMQPFDVLEDDSRDWKKAQSKLLDQVPRGRACRSS